MIRAIEFTDRVAFTRRKLPGSFWLGLPESVDLDQLKTEGCELFFWYCCPCGCGAIAPIVVGNGFKPSTDHASWRWNGSRTEPALEPSVHHVGHWHGWLRDGYWESVG